MMRRSRLIHSYTAAVAIATLAAGLPHRKPA